MYDEQVLSYRYAVLTCAELAVSASWCETRRFEFEACVTIGFLLVCMTNKSCLTDMLG